MTLAYQSTPLQELEGHPILLQAGVRVLVKREDMNHPCVSGNKWWKLKYNLEAAVGCGHHTVLTFGGAYSNHIYATAAAAAEYGLKSVGIIRGEETLPLNSTLTFAKEKGMTLRYVSRSAYRVKESREFVQRLREDFGEFFLIPEGGSNLLAVKGCAEFAQGKLSGLDFDHLIVPTGTGGTIAGLICGLEDRRNVIGVSVLKGADFLTGEVQKMVYAFTGKSFNDWSIRYGYHHGGYAKVTPELTAFMHETEALYELPLDPIYTAKAFWGLIQDVKARTFKRGDTLLFLHTGGLQGRRTLSEYHKY